MELPCKQQHRADSGNDYAKQKEKLSQVGHLISHSRAVLW
jgi:hypothetical protein